MERIKIALLGFGTVGTGTYELLKANKKLIEDRIGVGLEVSKILFAESGRLQGLSIYG